MMKTGIRTGVVSPKAVLTAAGAVLVLILVFAKPSRPQAGSPAVTVLSPSKQTPVQTNLVSDIPGLAITQDANLIDPWGIANSAASPYWISDQGTDRSTLYNGAGTASALIVEVPPLGTPSGPTGMIAVPSGAAGFLVPGTTSTAHFIFDTLDGTVAAWASGGAAVTAVTTSGAVYTGLAFANNGTANYLYAANFVSGGTIQVFDSSFHSATLAASFSDPVIPASYAPFNIQTFGGNLYVTYAQVSPAAGFPNAGSGLGYVDEFDANGNLLAELVAANSALNAPWGLAMSPAGFAEFPNALLVGNFGNGEINAFDPAHGTFLGTIADPEDRPIKNEGLWAIEFGNGNMGSSPTTLYLTAGINGAQDGLFAAISPGPVTLTFGSQLVGTVSTTQTIMVENTGSATLNLTATPALSGADSAEFAIGGAATCTNSAAIPAGGACTIPVTFTPAAAGVRGPVTLTIADNASGGTQTVTITGTGTAGAPTVSITPTTPISFSGQIVSSTSAAQTVTIKNTGTAGLVFGAGAVGVSNDFAETDTCSNTTVAVNATCTISVTFTPSSTTNNPRSGTVTITNNASNSPQTVALTGTGWDFSVTAPTTSTVTHGMQDSVTATIGALGGFTGTVTLSCTAAIPNGSCSVTPSSVPAPGTATVNLTTAASLPPSHRKVPPISLWQVPFLIGALALLFSAAMAKRRLQLGLAGAILFMIAMAGCSSNSNSATPTGQYQVAVTGSSGGVTRTTNVTLTVSP